MATYDPITNTYQLTEQEKNFGLPPDATDASLIGNALDNDLTGNDSDNFIDGSGGGGHPYRRQGRRHLCSL